LKTRRGTGSNTFRRSLQNYDRLLAAARDGDTVLLKRIRYRPQVQRFATVSKITQLDRLLPMNLQQAEGLVALRWRNLTFQSVPVSVEMSTLFNERETAYIQRQAPIIEHLRHSSRASRRKVPTRKESYTF
jgi:hypothetical protein